MKKINSILEEVMENITPPKENIIEIENFLENFKEKVLEKLKILKINAEIFVGGSFAKKTLIKKDKYDIDVFLRFDDKYKNEEISELTKKILENFEEVSIVHGSRDYFKIKINGRSFLELIPVKKIQKPDQAVNITDLSYLHVKYINKKLKSKQSLNEVMLTKAFCHANQCYGAESYINGFSGYGLELLIYHYKSFLKFIKAMVKSKKEKIIIDIEKYYKNKKLILMDLNSSKLKSPIILIDPTYRQRNVLAALSDETFKKFKKACKKFLNKPHLNDFYIKKTNLEKIKNNAKNKDFEFILFEAATSKPEGDVAGTKLIKFYKHLEYEIKRYFDVKDKGFNYNGKNNARYFFVVKNKKEFLITGPSIKDQKNVKAFEKVHKNYFTRKGKIYSKERVDFNIEEFFIKWKKKNKRKIKEMYITGLNIL